VPSELDRLKRLMSEATPGPWGINKYGGIGTGDHFIFGGFVITGEGFDADCAGNAAELICAMRNALQALLAVAETSKRVLAELRWMPELARPCIGNTNVAVIEQKIAELTEALAALEKEEKSKC
jgi:hypothetical protein